MFSEFEVNRQIDNITRGDDAPLRKARRLINLSRSIGRFAIKLSHGAVIMRGDGDEGADRLQQTLNRLRKLQEDARMAAFNALKSEPKSLGFQVQPEQRAYPQRWIETREHFEVRPSYN